jgi:putative hydroxymethylpyrimidine transport system substrate-binding protein
VKKILVTAVLLIALVAVAAGCGEKEDATGKPRLESVDLVLDFFPNADHVGIYAAMADGDFAKAGLKVTPRAPSDPSAPLKLLAAGKADLAISYEPELLMARDQGLKLVSVGAIVQKPLTSIIALADQGVDKPAQLQGKKVGTAGIPYQSGYLKTILKEADVNPNTVDEINVGFNLIPAMLSKRVNATLGGFWNYEGVQLKLRKTKGKPAPPPPTIIPVDQAGVPTYNELVVVARKQDLADGGGKVRRFMRALTAGYEAARDDPAKAVGQLVKANPDLDRKLQLASVKATLPVFFPENDRLPFGNQDPKEWEAYGRWMLDNGLLKESPTSGARPFTNEFLPGQGI